MPSIPEAHRRQNSMKKSEFNKMFRQMIKDSRDGYFGYDEIMEECWDLLNNEQLRNKELWKEVQRFRKNNKDLTWLWNYWKTLKEHGYTYQEFIKKFDDYFKSIV